MKNLGKLFALLGLFLLVNITESKAQISFSAGLRFAPAWAPVEYAHHTRYYYLPDLDGYYDASLGGYYFHDEDGDDWFFTRTLPESFQGFDFYSSPRIALEYFGDRPFEFFRDRRLGYFNEYHPDGRIPYYSGYYRGIDRNRDGYRNYDAGRNFHQDRDFYAHENYGDRRDYNNNRGINHFEGNAYRNQDNVWNQRRNETPRQEFHPQNFQSHERNWGNGERNNQRGFLEQRNQVIARNDHFRGGNDHRGSYRN